MDLKKVFQISDDAKNCISVDEVVTESFFEISKYHNGLGVSEDDFNKLLAENINEVVRLIILTGLVGAELVDREEKE